MTLRGISFVFIRAGKMYSKKAQEQTRRLKHDLYSVKIDYEQKSSFKINYLVRIYIL